MSKTKTKAVKKKSAPAKKKMLKSRLTKNGKLKTKKKTVKAVKVKKVRIALKKQKPKAKKTAPVRKRIVVKVASEISKPAEKVVKVKRFKPNKKTRYSKTELKHFREIILQERKQIFESAKANMDALVDKDSGEYKGDNLTYSSHMAEQGTDEMEREKNYLFVQRDEKYLGYLQEALIRIDQGTYGICIDCKDNPKNLCRTCPLIAKERLELVPITQHCIECKNLRG